MGRVVVYGIGNCDTVRKVRRWLEERKVVHCFHDFRRDGAQESLIGEWLKAVSADRLLNRQSATWRALTDSERDEAQMPGGVLRLLCAHPTLIRRPVVQWESGELTAGFDLAGFERLLAESQPK